MAQLTLQQAFDLALQHHKAGRLPEAENLYQQILARDPAHFGALHLLGVIAHQAGRDDLAVNLIGRAIAIDAKSPEAHVNLGNALKNSGQLDAAIAAYRRAVALNPDFPEAHNNLGNALRETGRFDEALAACRRAIVLRPDFPEAHSNLGNVLRDKGELDEAIAEFGKAIALSPNLAGAFNNLGNALTDKGRFDEAIAAYRQAIALKPGYAEAHNNLGNALKDKGQFDQAIAACRRAIALRPGYAEAHSNLGNALKDNGQLDEAIAAYGKAIAFNPALPEVHSNLGNVLREKGRLEASVAACRRAIALRPGYAEAHNNLGNALKDWGRLDEAVATFSKAIGLKPNYAEARSNLGNALKVGGQLDEAIAAYRQALLLKPDYVEAHGNLVFALLYHPGYDAQVIAEEHRRWSRQYAEPLRPFIKPHDNSRDPDRTLRVGYVSADFRRHSVSWFLLPLFRHHDHGACKVICYSDVQNEDSMTENLRACADEWHRIAGLTDERVAEKVRSDQIDILVDLAGHTAGNRLRVFARKPAPVQVTYLGYPATTGLSEIDYRLTDALADPPGLTESLHTEKLWRLPVCNWCFADPEEAPPVRASRPEGPICFGSFNNFAKASPAVMELWAKILTAIPSSRMILKSRGLNDPGIQRRIVQFFESRGVPAERLEIRGSDPDTRSHLDVYNRLDIALDSFPYHGTTTTCEALWIGVPVITLAGPSHASRVGVSLLSNVGLPDLIAESADQYVSIAVALAGDLPRLAELRRTLRQRMGQSPLMDAPRFARDVEKAYRSMWMTWCRNASAAN